jgi:hypothetical protein
VGGHWRGDWYAVGLVVLFVTEEDTHRA